MPASKKHVLDYEGLQRFKSKLYTDLATIYVPKPATALTAATKCKITYDANGLVTAGADLSASDIPNLGAGKITSGTFADARIASAATWNAKYDKPSTGIPLSDLADEVKNEFIHVKPDGTNALISNNKISLTYIPDIILGQLIFGGTVTGTGIATLSTNAKTKLGTTSSSITLTNNTTAITGYVANEGIFYVVSSDGNFASLGLKTGDWLVSTGESWKKVDNTDEVTSVQIQGTANVLSSSTATAQTGNVVTTLNLIAGHGDTVNPYGSKTKNYILAAPSSAAGTPSFRALVAADIPNLSAAKITSGTLDKARLPAYVPSQLVYGGTVNANTAVATLNSDSQSKLNTTASTMTLHNASSSEEYFDGSDQAGNKGIFYIVSTAGTFAGMTFNPGDWLISTGDAWRKVPVAVATTAEVDALFS